MGVSARPDCFVREAVQPGSLLPDGGDSIALGSILSHKQNNGAAAKRLQR